MADYLYTNYNAYQCEICGTLFSESELRNYHVKERPSPKAGCKVYWATAGRCGDAMVICPTCQDRLDNFVTTGYFETRFVPPSDMEKFYDENGDAFFRMTEISSKDNISLNSYSKNRN